MWTPEALTLLKSLNDKELKAFEKFLNQRHSKHSAIIKVMAYLKKHLDNVEPIEKRKAFARIFPQETYRERLLTDTASDLNLECLRFLMEKKLSTQSWTYQELKLEILQERKLHKPASELQQAMLRQLEEVQQVDIWHFIDKLKLLDQMYFSPSALKWDAAWQELGENLVHQLELFFWGAKLRFTCEALSREKLRGESIPHSLKETLAPEHEFTRELSQLHRAFWYTGKAIEEGSVAAFTDLKNQLSDYQQLLTSSDFLLIFTYLCNHLGHEIRQGQGQLSRELFELYRWGFEQQVLIENGVLNVVVFHNLVELACVVQELDWCHYFISEISALLEWNVRESAKNVAEALLAFEHQNYAQAEMLISKGIKMDINHHLRIKTLEMRLAYEQMNHDPEIPKLLGKRLEEYIKAQEVSDSVQAAYLNFIVIYRQLIRKKSNPQKIMDELNACTYIVNKNWLLAKLNEKH
jgi:hypothetical protein